MASTKARGTEARVRDTASSAEHLRAQLEELDGIIQTLETTLEQKRQERVEILHAIKAATILSAPKPLIHRLPVEILVETFQNISQDQRLRNITLMRVCSRWLNVVSDTAGLWSDIDLNIADPTRPRPLLVYAMTCLERSKMMELSITFNLHRFNPLSKVFDGMVKEISNTLPGDVVDFRSSLYVFNDDWIMDSQYNPSFTHAIFVAVVAALRGRGDCFIDRWTRLSLCLLDDSWNTDEIEFMWSALNCETPNLRDIYLYGPHTWEDDEIPLLNLDNVRSLSVGPYMAGYTSLFADLPHLQQLSIDNESPVMLRSTMEGLSSTQFLALEYLRCGFPRLGWVPHQTSDIIHLPALKSLDLDGGLYEEILPYIDAPILERLALSDHHPLAGRDLSAIPVLQSVTRLEWHAVLPDEEKLDARLLAVVPKLPQLGLVYLRYHHNSLLSSAVETTIAQLVAEDKTKARMVSKEEACVKPFQIPLFWDQRYSSGLSIKGGW